MADAAPNGAAGPATIVLSQPPGESADANPFADAPPGGAAPAAETPQKAEPEKKPDADDLVLDLIRRGRSLSNREKAIEARERTINDRVKPYEDLFASARKDPLAFVIRVGEAAGLDVDAVVEAYTAHKSGGQAKLPDDHPIRALQSEIAELKQQLQDKDKTDGDKQADALVQGHITDLKTLASQNAQAFPLFQTEPEAHAYQAFDLMAAHHKAGHPITHAVALQRIEAVLREDTDKKSAALGYQKPAATPSPSPNQPSPTPIAAPRASTPTAAPLEATSAIRSDEDIAADWGRMTRGAA